MYCIYPTLCIKVNLFNNAFFLFYFTVRTQYFINSIETNAFDK